MSGWRSIGEGAWTAAPAGTAGGDVYLWVETSPDTTQKSTGLPLRLWLQLPCLGENLWFLGKQHLSFTQIYVETPDLLTAPPSALPNSREKVSWLPNCVRQLEDREALLSYLHILEIRLLEFDS